MNRFSDTHPSRAFKFCPACGAPEFSFSGEKLFTCPSCGFIYYINPAPAVAAIIEAHDGRILLTRRRHDPGAGLFDLPGGFVDIMESAEEALTREIREELGIGIKSMRFMASRPNEYVYRGLSYFTCDMGFICTTDEIDAIKPADDVSEALLVKPEAIDFAQIGFPSIEMLLKTYIEMWHSA